MDANGRECQNNLALIDRGYQGYLMNGDYLLEKELVYKLTGAAMAVLNGLGHGLREKTYERALVLELRHLGIQSDCQRVFPVIYRGEKIDEYIPDLTVEDRVIIETKTVESITDEHRGQVLNYLKITSLPVGVIFNFKHPKLQWERIVLEKNH